jgi:DNA polymerase-3 subunit epsilon
MKNLSVIDVETTGFGKMDRVVEMAVVVLHGETLEVVDEYDTLINPQRDIGATHVHGITPSMVQAAPTFEEVSSQLADILNDTVLVAHNLPFDARFLRTEFSRTTLSFDAGAGVCTLKLTGEKLDLACTRYGISIETHHRALADARATAHIVKMLELPDDRISVQVAGGHPTAIPRTLRRDSVGGLSMPLKRTHASLRYPTQNDLAASYLDVLDTYLDDLVLDEVELMALQDLATDYGFDASRQHDLHQAYIHALIAAASRDSVITQEEHELISLVSSVLGTDLSVIPMPTEVPEISTLSGARVCFTGKFTVGGREITKEQLAQISAAAGLQPVGSVSKSGCDLLVASDPTTSSGKAGNARKWGIPVMGIDEFLDSIGSSEM